MHAIDKRLRYLRVGTCVLMLNHGKVLLQKRKKAVWMGGHYSLPGGHLEPRETMIDCAVREAKEELGIELDRRSIDVVHITHKLEAGEELCCFL